MLGNKTFCFTRKVQACFFPHPKSLQVAMEFLSADALSRQDRADVAGFGHHPGKCHAQSAVGGVILEVLSASRKFSRNSQLGVRGPLTLIHNRSQGHDFACGTRLKNFCQCSIPTILFREGSRIIGVICGCSSQCENVTGLGIHHHNNAAIGTRCLHLFGNCLLGHMLNIAINRQMHGSPRSCVRTR